MRALVIAMDQWLRDGREPSPSVYPTIANGTLLGRKEALATFPTIPGMPRPGVMHVPPLLDRGPEWDTKGIATIEPPVIKGWYGALVPACNPDGNERGTLMLPTVAVPVATFTSWNLRSPEIGAPGELLSLKGGYIPLPKTAADARATADPRQPLSERYKDFADYQQQFTAAAEKLVAERYLLEQDLPALKTLSENAQPLFSK
jgi:hypothetical protein